MIIFNNNSIGYVLDTDASKVIEAVRSTGVTITFAMMHYAHYLISNMKAIGTWQLSNAVYGFVGGTAASHKWNWKDLRDVDAAFRLTFPNGATHDANGTSFNGINQYANTFLSATALPNANVFLSFYSGTNSNQTGSTTIGAITATSDSRLILRRESNNFFLLNSNPTLIDLQFFPNTDSRGMHIGKINSNVISLIKNGINLIPLTSGNLSKSSIPNVPYFIAASNSAGTATEFDNKQARLVAIGTDLTDIQDQQQSQIVTNAQAILNRL